LCRIWRTLLQPVDEVHSAVDLGLEEVVGREVADEAVDVEGAEEKKQRKNGSQ
jgi:hypothetical protein